MLKQNKMKKLARVTNMEILTAISFSVASVLEGISIKTAIELADSAENKYRNAGLFIDDQNWIYETCGGLQFLSMNGDIYVYYNEGGSLEESLKENGAVTAVNKSRIREWKSNYLTTVWILNPKNVKYLLNRAKYSTKDVYEDDPSDYAKEYSNLQMYAESEFDFWGDEYIARWNFTTGMNILEEEIAIAQAYWINKERDEE